MFELLIVYVLLSVYSCPYLISCVTSYVTFLYMCMHNTVGQLPIDFSRLYGCDWTIASRVQGYHNSHGKLLMDKASIFSPITFTLLVTQIGCRVVTLVADKLKRQWLCIVYLLIA